MISKDVKVLKNEKYMYINEYFQYKDFQNNPKDWRRKRSGRVKMIQPRV